MANESIKIKDSMSIKKQTVKDGKVEKTVFFFPDQGLSIEAPSYEEALKILKEGDNK
jgi:hypothetical protein